MMISLLIIYLKTLEFELFHFLPDICIIAITCHSGIWSMFSVAGKMQYVIACVIGV